MNTPLTLFYHLLLWQLRLPHLWYINLDFLYRDSYYVIGFWLHITQHLQRLLVCQHATTPAAFSEPAIWSWIPLCHTLPCHSLAMLSTTSMASLYFCSKVHAWRELELAILITENEPVAICVLTALVCWCLSQRFGTWDNLSHQHGKQHGNWKCDDKAT